MEPQSFLSAVRTAIGKFQRGLSVSRTRNSAADCGRSRAARRLEGKQVDEAIRQRACRRAWPESARQAALKRRDPQCCEDDHTKVRLGLKAVALAAQAVKLGESDDSCCRRDGVTCQTDRICCRGANRVSTG